MPVFSWARGCLLLPPAPTGDAWVLGSKQECIPVSLSSKLRTSPAGPSAVSIRLGEPLPDGAREHLRIDGDAVLALASRPIDVEARQPVVGVHQEVCDPKHTEG